jgi:hypothetical protein
MSDPIVQYFLYDRFRGAFLTTTGTLNVEDRDLNLQALAGRGIMLHAVDIDFTNQTIVVHPNGKGEAL